MMSEFGGKEQVSKLPQSSAISDEILEMGIRPTLEAVQRAISRHNISKTVSDLRSGEEDALFAAEALPVKAEINAIAGHFAEHAWKAAKRWIAEHPGEIGSNVTNDFDVEPIPHRVMYEMFERDTQLGLNNLRKFSMETLLSPINNMFQPLFFEPQAGSEKYFTPEELPYEKKVMRRYIDIVKNSDVSNNPMTHLQAGLSTAHNISWALLEAIPRSFKAQREVAPDREQLEQLIKSARGLALYLATLELGVFQKVTDRILLQRDGLHRFLDMRDLKISERNGNLSTDIEPSALKAIVQGITSNQPLESPHKLRTGCPAVAARGPEGNNLVVEIFDWISELFWKFYFPQVIEKKK